MASSQDLYEVGSTGRATFALRRDDGSPVPPADVTEATCRLVDAHTKAVVNGRANGAGGQDILGSGSGANGFQIGTGTDPRTGETITQLAWDLAEADIALLHPELRPGEEHLADIVVRYNLGSGPSAIAKTIRLAYAVQAVDPRRLLCTFDDVGGAYDGYIRGGSDDVSAGLDDTARPLVTRLIWMFQDRVEELLERRFLKTTAAAPAQKVITVTGGQRSVYLDRWPIEETAPDSGVAAFLEVLEGSDGTWSNANALEAGRDFTIDFERGVLDLLFDYRVVRGLKLRVRWAGGLFDDVAQVPRRLREQVARQVAYWWQRRTTLGAGSIAMAGVNVQISVDKDWLKDTQAVIDSLVRYDEL